MSTVQLSRSAPERPFARCSAPSRGRSSACRALFGPMDHEELEREMESRLLEVCERDRLRWNFDFETDTPLCGEYKWEAVGVGETPVFYRGSVRWGARHVAAADKREAREVATREDRAVRGGSAACPAMERLCIPVAQRGKCSPKLNSARAGRGSKRRASAPSGSTSSTRVTDYYAKKRRISTGKPGDRASQVAVGRTPRRRIR